MYHFVLWCTFCDFAVTLSFLDCYRWFSHIFNDTLRSVPSSSAVAYLVVGMPAAYLMGFTLKGGVEGIFYSFAISLMVAALLFAFFYHRFMKAKG